MYLGRGIASHEVNGHSSRVGKLGLGFFATAKSTHSLTYHSLHSLSVVRAQSSGKIIVQFDEVWWNLV
jgi:hypothetical protein